MASTSKHEKDEAFVVISEEQTGSKKGTEETRTEPKIYDMKVEAKVRNRFAHTTVTSRVRNTNGSAKETTFSVVLPEKAFISEFVMTIGENSYVAYVKKKEEAQHIYDEAVQKGKAAAQVAVSARDSNRFDVSVNVEPLSTVSFQLTYEELLKRKENTYELIINIHPKQLVEKLLVNVFIDESRPLKFVRAPALRSGEEITEKEGDLDPKAEINQFGPASAVVRFEPNVERQKEIATIFDRRPEEGFAGQFVVQYDVERDPNGGEVLIQEGYFIHFFAPDDIKPLNKHIVFVLDISGSMGGQKIEQLKWAMHTILQQLDKEDYFHIICFDSRVNVLDLDVQDRQSTEDFYEEEIKPVSEQEHPPAFSANRDNIAKVKEIVGELEACGGTNIYKALRIALILIQRERRNGGGRDNPMPKPMIMFLTDGEPTAGVCDKDVILSDMIKFNEGEAPIFTLSFGEDADKTFLRKLAQKNHAFSRHIYEASDAALQLQNFYKEIASPLLSDVKFEYRPGTTTSLTRTTFPLHFGGGEIVVAGRLDGETFPEVPRVKCCGRNGPVVLKPVLQRPVTSLERLWAYLTVRQLLDEREIAPDKTVVEQKALDLALRYSFVTPVTSLVVVKPDSSDFSVDPESASKGVLPELSSDFSVDPESASKSVLPEELEEMPEMCVTEEIVIKKKVIKKRAIKKRKGKAPESCEEVFRIPKKSSRNKVECVEMFSFIETIEPETQKCKRTFLWTLAVRLLRTGALFRVPLFVSLFFYFLIMW